MRKQLDVERVVRRQQVMRVLKSVSRQIRLDKINSLMVF